MLIEAIVLSILIALLRGGKLSRFRTLKEKTLWFFIIGILIQSFILFLQKLVGIRLVDRILMFNKEIYILSYILILIGVIMNYMHKGLWISFLGTILNFLSMATNNWKKPILIEGLKLTENENILELIEAGSKSIFTPLIEGTKYPSLGNIIIFSKPYPLAKIISIGDMFMAIGIFILIQDIMFKEHSLFGN